MTRFGYINAGGLGGDLELVKMEFRARDGDDELYEALNFRCISF